MVPTYKVQTHHMSTHGSHLKAYSLALEAACVFMNGACSIEASATCTASF